MLAHRLYVGTIGEGLWRSLDAGYSYVRACDGMFVECHVRALVAHPQDPRILFLGTEQGLHVSRDGANNWSRVESPLVGQQIWSLLISPRDPRLMLAGTCPAALFRSEDGGGTWTQAEAAIMPDCPRIISNRVTSLLADPDDRDVLWAGVEIDGLFRSGDGGRTWQPVGRGMSSRDIHALAITGKNGRGRRFLATTNNDLNVSADGGATWKPREIHRVMPWPYCRALGQAADDPDVIFLGNGDAPPGCAGVIGRSHDGGVTWTMPTMPARANSTMWNFAVHRADPNLIYATSVSGEVYRSLDKGLSWEKLPREFGEIRALAWTP